MAGICSGSASAVLLACRWRARKREKDRTKTTIWWKTQHSEDWTKQRIQEKVKFQAQHNDDVDDDISDHNDDGKNNKRKSNGTKSAELKAEILNKSWSSALQTCFRLFLSLSSYRRSDSNLFLSFVLSFVRSLALFFSSSWDDYNFCFLHSLRFSNVARSTSGFFSLLFALALYLCFTLYPFPKRMTFHCWFLFFLSSSSFFVWHALVL